METVTDTPKDSETPTTFRLGYVPGVTPSKWVGMWKERHRDIPLELVPLESTDAGASVREGFTHASLVRLPIDRTNVHAIELYREVPVVVFPKDHHFAAADELQVTDLGDEVLQHPLDDTLQWEHRPGTAPVERLQNTKVALEVVAAGVGVVVVPQSVARLYHRKDLTYTPLDGAPDSPIALVWREGDEDPNIQEFIGIVRGRTANSSRGAGTGNADSGESKAAKKKAAAGAKAGGTTPARGAKSAASRSSKNASAKYARINKSRQAAKSKKRGGK